MYRRNPVKQSSACTVLRVVSSKREARRGTCRRMTSTRCCERQSSWCSRVRWQAPRPKGRSQHRRARLLLPGRREAGPPLSLKVADPTLTRTPTLTRKAADHSSRRLLTRATTPEAADLTSTLTLTLTLTLTPSWNQLRRATGRQQLGRRLPLRSPSRAVARQGQATTPLIQGSTDSRIQATLLPPPNRSGRLRQAEA